MKSLSISEILDFDFVQNPNKELNFTGWIKAVQDFGSIKFLSISDGSTSSNLQIIIRNPEMILKLPKKPSLGDIIQVSGYLITSKGDGQKYDLEALDLKLLKEMKSDYPIQSKEMSIDYLRSHQLFRHRTDLFHSIFEIRREMLYSIHTFLYNNGYFPVFAPILTTNSCEGGAELFKLGEKYISYFNKKQILLSVSGQFYCEVLSHGLKNTYSFGPAFRAEKSNSSNHLSEFWMLEIESAFSSLKDLIELTFNLFKYILRRVIEKCAHSLNKISKILKYKTDLLSRLQDVISSEYTIIKYDEAISLLSSHRKIEWGESLNNEDEKYLCALTKHKVVFITDFPSSIRPFYMKRDLSGRKTYSFDMLIDGLGEIASGSERECDIIRLRNSINQSQINEEEIDWYIKLREYGAYSSSGCGIGFERLLMFISGLKNIKDASVFPRSYRNLQI